MNVLVVDDEFFVRERILKQIPWEKMGMTDVRQAVNGEDALEQVRNFRPDLLLTDVRMAKMDGIQLAQEVIRIYPSCKIVFISGYSDTEYLRSAIKLHAVDYVEKPIQMEELIAQIAKAGEVIEKEQIVQKTIEAYESLDTDAMLRAAALRLTQRTTAASAAQDLSQVTNTASYSRFVTLVIRLLGNSDTWEQYEAELLRMITDEFKGEEVFALAGRRQENIVIHLMGKSSARSLSGSSRLEMSCQKINAMLLGYELTAVYGLGMMVSDLMDIYISYDGALLSLQRSFFHSPGELVVYRVNTADPACLDETIVSHFVHAITKSEPNNALFWIKSVTADIKQHDHTSPGDVVRFFSQLLTILIKAAKKEDLPLFPDFADEHELNAHLRSLQFVDDLSVFLLDGVQEYYTQLGHSTSDNGTVSRVVRYIHKNYSNPDLSVGMISDVIQLSPTYLCHLFKKSTGTTLVSYITQTRINAAMEYIGDAKYRVKDMAKLVGYRSGNYFSFQFKKHMGYSPSDRNVL